MRVFFRGKSGHLNLKWMIEHLWSDAGMCVIFWRRSYSFYSDFWQCGHIVAFPLIRFLQYKHFFPAVKTTIISPIGPSNKPTMNDGITPPKK